MIQQGHIATYHTWGAKRLVGSGRVGVRIGRAECHSASDWQAECFFLCVHKA